MQRENLGQTALTVYPIGNYTFGSKAPKKEKDFSVHERMTRWKAAYEKEGPRRTVEAIMVVTEHNHPHILLLQASNCCCNVLVRRSLSPWLFTSQPRSCMQNLFILMQALRL